MSQIIVTRSISQTAKLGNRLIKFRHGPQRNQPTIQHVTGTPSPAVQAKQGSQEAIWDFQIPARWRRSAISEEECAVINNGGRL